MKALLLLLLLFGLFSLSIGLIFAQTTTPYDPSANFGSNEALTRPNVPSGDRPGTTLQERASGIANENQTYDPSTSYGSNESLDRSIEDQPIQEEIQTTPLLMPARGDGTIVIRSSDAAIDINEEYLENSRLDSEREVLRQDLNEDSPNQIPSR